MTDHDHDHDHAHNHAHDHDHGHAHDHSHDHSDPFHPRVGAEVDIDELDPANRSLADALRVSFGVLKVLMIVLVGLFVFSGVFEVKQTQVAVRLHLGAVAGDPGQQVYGPGTYLGWPAPIDKLVVVPTAQQSIRLEDSFWFYVAPENRGKKPSEMPVRTQLIPGQDGSLITADKNIVHAQWTINYQVRKDDAVKFARNVGLASDDVLPDEYVTKLGEGRSLYHADQLVRFAAEEAIVTVTASTTADDFVAGRIDTGRIHDLIQQKLAKVASGITVGTVLPQFPMAPLSTRDAFQDVSSAQSEKTAKITGAQKQAKEILVAAAGRQHEELRGAIDAYDAARKSGDAAVTTTAYDSLVKLLDSAEGEVGRAIKEAGSYRSSAKQTIDAEAQRFTKLLPSYNESPRIVLDRLWQDTRQAIFAGDVETFYMPTDGTKELLLEINRDPQIAKARQRRAYEQQQQAAGKPPGAR
jgi:membrane protease subunit HflK